jgi:hypothetical protein
MSLCSAQGEGPCRSLVKTVVKPLKDIQLTLIGRGDGNASTTAYSRT